MCRDSSLTNEAEGNGQNLLKSVEETEYKNKLSLLENVEVEVDKVEVTVEEDVEKVAFDVILLWPSTILSSSSRSRVKFSAMATLVSWYSGKSSSSFIMTSSMSSSSCSV